MKAKKETNSNITVFGSRNTFTGFDSNAEDKVPVHNHAFEDLDTEMDKEAQHMVH
jgi:hypothetical protein